MDTDMSDVYLAFVRERHFIWEKRQEGLEPPWTYDPILAHHKFTNVFRVLDHGSQFLVKELLYKEKISYADALMRCFLYRYTNRPEPWIYFHDLVGGYPTIEDLDDGTVLALWKRYRAQGGPVFGNAFKMFSGAENKGTDRLTWAVNLTRDYFGEESPKSVTIPFSEAETQSDRLAVLTSVPRCANFMGMQVLTDMGYSPHHQADENEFVVAGPGAIVGAREIGLKADEAIAWAHGVLSGSEGRDTRLWIGNVFGYNVGTARAPSLMDVQNTFCEFGKYARYMRKDYPTGRKGYRAVHTPEKPFLPPHWSQV